MLCFGINCNDLFPVVSASGRSIGVKFECRESHLHTQCRTQVTPRYVAHRLSFSLYCYRTIRSLTPITTSRCIASYKLPNLRPGVALIHLYRSACQLFNITPRQDVVWVSRHAADHSPYNALMFDFSLFQPPLGDADYRCVVYTLILRNNISHRLTCSSTSLAPTSPPSPPSLPQRDHIRASVQ